jgi:eukaryotic-like serine/threonine-protein kinase
LSPQEQTGERIVGRYALHQEIASGGMATVHLGRLLGQVGFSRTVAVKRLHPQFAKDPEFVAMFLDEARLAGRIQHPNVVSTLDVVATDGELFLVMEYVHGESLSRLLRRLRKTGEQMPPVAVSSIMCGALHGLHAAHEARSERGQPLGIVHRDVSPHNIMVGLDGVARVLDFGVAKAVGRMQTTREGQLKGKLAYMAPEQLRGGKVDRRVDVYAAGVVLWESLAGRALFHGDNEGMVVAKVLDGATDPPSRYCSALAPGVDALVMRALEPDPEARWASARELALALEDAIGVASPRRVGDLVERLASESLTNRSRLVEQIESISARLAVPPDPGPGPEPAVPSPSVPEHEPEAEAPTEVSEPARAQPAAPPPEPATSSSTVGSSSQLSSISVSTPNLARALTSRRTKLALAFGALAALGLVALLAGFALRDGAAGARETGLDDAGRGPADTAQAADGGPRTPAETTVRTGPTADNTTPGTASASTAPDAGRAKSGAAADKPAATTHAHTSATGSSKPAVKFTRPD